MILKIFTYLCLFAAIFTAGFGNRRERFKKITTCATTIIEKICPNCISVGLTTPARRSWQADVLVTHFSDQSQTQSYVMTKHTMDRPRYENPAFDRVGMYLANTEVDVKITFKHFRVSKSEMQYIVLVHLNLSSFDLAGYIGAKIPGDWQINKALGIIFIGLFKGELQVFGTPVKVPRIWSARNFEKLSICDHEVPSTDSQITGSGKTVVKVVIITTHRLSLIEKNANVGGIVGDLMEAWGKKLNLTPKYFWNFKADRFLNFLDRDGLRMVFDLRAASKMATPRSFPSLTMEQGIWVIANNCKDKNVLFRPLRTNLLWYTVLLITYVAIMLFLFRHIPVVRLVLHMFGIFFGVGVSWWPKKIFHRFLLVFWCFGSYILVQGYLAALTTDFSAPASCKTFRTVTDLMESGMDTYCSKISKNFYCSLNSTAGNYSCDKCTLREKNWLSHINPKKLLADKSWRPFAFTTNKRTFKSRFNFKPFTKMEERIGTWPGMIYTNANEDIFNKMVNVSRRVFQSGNYMHALVKYPDREISFGKSKRNAFDISDFKDVAIILYVGWACSIVTFVIEILVKRYDKN